MTPKEAHRYLLEAHASIESVHRSVADSLQAAEKELGKLDGALADGRTTPHLEQAAANISTAASELHSADLARIPQAAKTIVEYSDKYRSAIDLVGQIVSSRPDMASSRPFDEFERLFKGDYHEFASKSNHPREAEAYASLTRVFERMRQIRLAPRLFSRNVCTVAGGFSSGKSSMLNALMGANKSEDAVLPTRITPTTSIPTYLFYGDDDRLTINVFNHDGGRIQIDTPMLQRMTHEFEHEHRVALTPIVNRVSIHTPGLKSWRRVAFVDTPGYTNPDEGGHVKQDRQVALEEIRTCRFLIWVVDCEKGALPREDVDLVRQLIEQNPSIRDSEKPAIYFVLNKADKKSASDRRAVLRVVADSVQKHAFPCFGIGLYSAHDNEWYDHTGRAFPEFLEMVDKVDNARIEETLDHDVKTTFDSYIEHHDKELSQFTEYHGALHRLGFLLPDEEDSSGRKMLDRLRENIQDRREYHRQNAADARSLQRRCQRCVREFMSSVEIHRAPAESPTRRAVAASPAVAARRSGRPRL